MLAYVFLILLFFTALFLILLVLVQRGKGGGLAGAFGGMGGQSAFGTKAGDTFTKITVGVAAFWIVLCVVSILMLSSSSSDGRLDRVGVDNTAVEEGAAGQAPAGGAGSTGGSESTGGGSGSPSEGTNNGDS
jgi:preprotein translocase subunit SecG